jgi:hypothetical protein
MADVIAIIIAFSTAAANNSVMTFSEFSSYRYLLALLILIVGHLNACHLGVLWCEFRVLSFMKAVNWFKSWKGVCKKPAFFPLSVVQYFLNVTFIYFFAISSSDSFVDWFNML